MPHDFLTTAKFTAMEGFALAKPPSWTRLEPQATTGDPRPGIEARVHDPLWLIGRQWQLGEFQGEDAGTPLTVRAVTRTRAVDRWAREPRPGESPASVVIESLGAAPQDLLEPLIEREPVLIASPGLRPRAEAGAVLLAALDDADLGVHRAEILEHCPLDLEPASHPDGARAALDPQWQRLVRLLGGSALVDAERLCLAVEAAIAAGGWPADATAVLPAWLAPEDATARAALAAVIDPWRAWYRAEVSPSVGGDDAWHGERLEYRFSVAAGDTVLRAPSHGGGDIDWHSFDPAPGETLPRAAEAPAEIREVHALLASPLRFAGMPADRFWEMEDSQVNMGAIDTEPWDLARLLVAEFALTCGNDWIVVPVDVPFGSLTTVESVIYTTTFGERFVVRPTASAGVDGHWRMFAIAAQTGVVDGLLVPPGAVAVQDGPVIEDVLFLRDEMANLAWAVERSVQGPSGSARDRSRERGPTPPPGRGPVAAAQLDYRLQSSVPVRWIPLLPRSSGHRAIDLIQGRMPGPDGTVAEPLGRTLNRADLRTIKDAEVPREGVSVRRQHSMTRRADGSYLRWITRRVGVGRGEGASRLMFDAALSRKPGPGGVP